MSGIYRGYEFERNYATIDGATKSWAEWCDERGLKRSTVKNRMRRGDSFESACAKSVRADRKNKSWWFDSQMTINVVTRTPEEWRLLAGLCRQAVYQRTYRCGWTMEEALSYKKGETPERVISRDDEPVGDEKELCIHPTPEVVEMCTNCPHPDCISTITRCLKLKRRREKKERNNA